MRPLSKGELVGTWGTVLLPINKDDSIDWGRLSDELDFLISSGLNGIYTNGTAGEFWTQSEAEFDRLHDLLAERCEKARLPFQIGITHPSPQLCLARLNRARQWNPSAFQLILPDWCPPSDAETVAFLSRVADAAAPIGLVLYNPPHAKQVLNPDQWGKLTHAISSLLGVKVVDGDQEWYRAMAARAPGLSIFVPGHRLATGLRHGASGSYSNIACLHPAGAQRWCQMMRTQPDAALRLETRIQQFLQKHIPSDYSNPAKDKFLAAVGGWAEIGTRLRWPYQAIPEHLAARVRPLARKLLPELFEPGAVARDPTPQTQAPGIGLS